MGYRMKYALRTLRPLAAAAGMCLAAGCGLHRIESVQGTVSDIDSVQLKLLVGEHAVAFDIRETLFVNEEDALAGCRATVFYEGRLHDRRGRAVRVEIDPLYARLTGRWIETGDGADPEGMGMELYADGKASSIGMQTVIFSAWSLAPDGGLRLKGHIFGPGQSVSFDEVWEIQEMSRERLVLAQEDMTLAFRREWPEETYGE